MKVFESNVRVISFHVNLQNNEISSLVCLLLFAGLPFDIEELVKLYRWFSGCIDLWRDS